MSGQKKLILLPALIISIFGSFLFSVTIVEAAGESSGSSVILPNLQVAISGFGGFQKYIDCQQYVRRN